MKNLINITEPRQEIKSDLLFKGNEPSCSLCDSGEKNLTLVSHYDTEYYLCDEHLYLLLTLTGADHYFSPASCTYG